MANNNEETPGGKPGDSNDGPRIDLTGVAKRGPGRPRKDGQPTGTNPASSKGSSKRDESDALGDAEFLADACVTLLELGDEVIQRSLLRKIEKALPAKAKEFQELQNAMRLNPRDTALMRKCLLRIAQKYQMLSRFAPEILLLGLLAQYGVRQVKLMKAVDELTLASMQRAEKAMPGPVANPVGTN